MARVTFNLEGVTSKRGDAAPVHELEFKFPAHVGADQIRSELTMVAVVQQDV